MPTRILVVSDLHGDLGSVEEAVAAFRPDALLSCGDWGDPDEVDVDRLKAIVGRQPTATTFGNHDPLELLAGSRDRDGRAILIPQGSIQDLLGLRVAAIGGIWAKSHRLPHYVTDEDVADFSRQIAQQGGVDVFLTHGCPVGVADLTPTNRHGGQRCFLEASHAIAPRIHLCGHLHRAQERTLKDGRRVLNVGATPEGCVVLIDHDGERLKAALERFDRASSC